MRGLRVHPARVLANRPLGIASESAFEAAVEVFEWQSAGSAQRPHRPETEPSTAPALGQPGPELAGLQPAAQCRGKLRGVCPDMPGRLPRLSTSRAYPLGLGLS